MRATCAGLPRRRRSSRAERRARTRASSAKRPCPDDGIVSARETIRFAPDIYCCSGDARRLAGKRRENHMSIEALRQVVAQLNASATALAALGAELHSRVSGKPLNPALRAHADDLLRETGA